MVIVVYKSNTEYKEKDMMIFTDNICRGIYFLDTTEVCFDGYNYFTGFYTSVRSTYKADEIIQHIKRAVPKKKQDKEIFKTIKIDK